MNRRRKLLSILISLCVINCSCLVPFQYGDDLILTLPGDAVTAGMSEATTASVSGAPAIFSNPAGLARVDVGSLAVMHTAYLENINYSTLATSLPFGFHNALGVGVSYLNFGSLPSYDSTGVEAPTYAPKDLTARIGVGKSFYRTSIGASLFFLQSKIAESATTFGASLGVHQRWGPVSWAAALENAGRGLTYVQETKPLPTQQRLGVSVQLLPTWTVNMDAVKQKTTSTWFALGNELRWEFGQDMSMSLRGGYNTRDSGQVPGLSGISGGLGFGWRETELNYAWVPFGDLGQTHRISMQVFFGSEAGGTTSEREHRTHSLLVSRLQSARHPYGEPKSIRATKALPMMPWKNKMSGWRTAKDKMMSLLAQDALCSTTGARALVTKIRGTVVLRTNEPEGRWPRLHTGQYLFEGDTIRTYGAASADLLFANGTKAQLSPNTVLKVETKQEICDTSLTSMEQGDVYMSATDGKELRVKTPFGDAAVVTGDAHLTFDGKTAHMRVQKGVGSFTTTDGVVTPVQEKMTFNKTTEGRTTKRNVTADSDQPVVIADPDRNTVPGRWDPDYAKKLQTEVMRLDSMPGLQVGEYVRDVRLRNELKLRIYDLLKHQEDLRQQDTDLTNDVKQFSDLKKNLSVIPENEEYEVMKDRLKSLKQATRVLARAQEKLRDIQDELKKTSQDTRENQEYLAAMPIVRMLNVTADDTTVPFEQGRAVLSTPAQDVLNTIADTMSIIKPFRVVIEGHTDQSGTNRVNARLSKARADAVAAYLRKRTNMAPRSFLTKGRGATQPLIDEDSPGAMEKNRRVEIWFELRGL